MKPAELFQRSAQRGSYCPFDFSIRLHSNSDVGVFWHEYWHHVQNTTTVRGIERILNFLQVLAWVSRACKLSSRLPFPFQSINSLSKLNCGLSDEVVANINAHWDLYLYWEQPYLVPTSSWCSHDHEVIIDTSKLKVVLAQSSMMDGEMGTVPFLLLPSNNDISYPISGHSISEGGALGIERLAAETKLPLTFPFSSQTWPYDVVHYLLANETECDEVDMLSVVATDFALSHGSAGLMLVNFLLEATDFFRGGSRSNDEILDFQNEVSASFHEVLSLGFSNLQQELNRLVDSAKDQPSSIRKLFDWVKSNLTNAQRLRINDPTHFSRPFLKKEFSVKNFREILRVFPPVAVTVDGRSPRFAEGTDLPHRITASLFRLVEWWICGPQVGSPQRLGCESFEVEIVQEANSTFRLRPPMLASGETTDDGHALEVLGFDEVLFCLTEPN